MLASQEESKIESSISLWTAGCKISCRTLNEESASCAGGIAPEVSEKIIQVPLDTHGPMSFQYPTTPKTNHADNRDGRRRQAT